VLLAALCVATALVTASAVPAGHTGYWFYQGNLPTGSGAITVLHGADVSPPAYVRASWSPCTHDLKAIFIANDGSWLGYQFFYGFGCDQYVKDDYPELHNNYGCQNPWSQVWVNCRAGTNV